MNTFKWLCIVLALSGLVTFVFLDERKAVVEEKWVLPLFGNPKMVETEAEFLAVTGAVTGDDLNAFQKTRGSQQRTVFNEGRSFRFVESDIFKTLAVGASPLTFVDVDKMKITQAMVNDEDGVVVFTDRQVPVWGDVKHVAYDAQSSEFTYQVAKFSLVNELLGMFMMVMALLLARFFDKVVQQNRQEIRWLQSDLTNVRRALSERGLSHVG